MFWCRLPRQGKCSLSTIQEAFHHRQVLLSMPQWRYYILCHVSLSLWILANINSATTVIYIYFSVSEQKAFLLSRGVGQMVPPSGMFQEIKNYLEINKHETTTIQSLWDITKTVLRGNCIMIQAYYRKWKKISNKQLNFVSKGNRERRTNKSWSL